MDLSAVVVTKLEGFLNYHSILSSTDKKIKIKIEAMR